MKAYLREKENYWHIRYVDQKNPKNKEFIESFDKANFSRKDIQSKIDHINHEIKFKDHNPWQARRSKKISTKKRIPIGEAISLFIQENDQSGRWMPNTKWNYETHLKQITDHFGGSTPVNELSPAKLQQWLSGLDVVPLTKLSYARKANTFFTWLYNNNHIDEEWKLTLTNLEQKKLRNEDTIKYITYNQLQDICRGYRWRVQADKRAGFVQESFDEDKYPDIWWFMFWQMLRYKELPKITRDDVNLSQNQVRIHGKGNKIEWMYVVPPAQKILQRRLNRMNNDRVFNIGPKSSRHYDNFRKACNLALGNDHSSGLHQLRHGGAVHYFTIGKETQFVSKMLRHETIEVTLRVYADVLDDKLQGVFSDIKDQPAL